MSKKQKSTVGSKLSGSQVRRPLADVQLRRLATDVQALRARPRRPLATDLQARRTSSARGFATDVQAAARAGDLQLARGAKGFPVRSLATDVQRFKLPDDLQNLLIERYETIARMHEAQAELSLAKGILSRIEARLAEMGYFIKQ